MMKNRTSVMVLFACAAGMAAGSMAQCPYDWVAVGKLQGVGPGVLRYLTTNEGTFVYIGLPSMEFDGEKFSHMARWDGKAWESMAAGWPGPSFPASELLVFDVGFGPELIATSSSGGMYRWEGGSWKYYTAGAPTRQLVVDLDGPGGEPAELWGVHGVGSNHNVYRFQGDSWHVIKQPVGSVNVAPYKLIMHDDGSGPTVFGCGDTWLPFKPALTSTVVKMGGDLGWVDLAGGLVNTPACCTQTGALLVSSIASFDEDGAGPSPARLFAAGRFTQSFGGAPMVSIARWDGRAWSDVGGGFPCQGPSPETCSDVTTLHVFDDGAGERLVAAGIFSTTGSGSASSIASWDGERWRAFGEGIVKGPGMNPFQMITVPGPSGPELWMFGSIKRAGSLPDATNFGYLVKWAPCGESCFADANGDGSLNIDDFIHFQSLYAVGNPGADCTQEGELNMDDFVCYQSVYALGC